MAKEESGRLFSKVAKFVRNPLKDWSELDAPSSSDSSLPDQAYSREMLKEMIERRQRNDFVRRREFDMLRKLRQREAAAHAFEATVTPSSFNLNSSSEKPEGRALTLKKIDEIEQQMSQQWWKGRGPNGETLVNPPPDAGAETLPPVHAGDPLEEQAERVPAPAATAAVAPVTAGSPPVASSAPLMSSRLAHDGALEEAVIRFAHGDDAGAEAILLQALASESPTASDGESDHPTAERDDSRWRALFDLYRATGDAAKFAAARMRYAQRMKRMGPDWVSLEELARSVKAVTASEEAVTTAEGGSADWTSPARLAREGLMGLTRALSQAGSVWTLDWRGLSAIEPDAAAPLRALFAHWADSPVQLRFMGTAQLLAVLSEAAPNNDRGTNDIWWQLHLAALRMMHLPDDFELVALNYCITYEVSPPSWQDPKGEYTSLAAPPASRHSSVWSLLSVGGDSDSFPSTDSAFAALAGDLRGDSLSCWQRLDNDLRHTTAPVISCAALVRMDLVAAGTLLSWVRARDANGERVQFVDAHRLMAALFNLIGIADHATVAIRKN
ncbi:STAS domain-containing protein [Variovorax sp. PAMC26660]|uniref:STAS domain-containing protein n=1 Tax=Variovorax sp. PAMC26660 TaxID=2762322 RepID=UPI00164D6AEF|nr:STAS domain-containing protein [Variovorax sp. PAMC26660]QNK71229.1 STAS domain-containing protein [Variovorax sp. PAMC26660]